MRHFPSRSIIFIIVMEDTLDLYISRMEKENSKRDDNKDQRKYAFSHVIFIYMCNTQSIT
jgi:hypothetical protein